jgi:hypothetical protein
MPLSEHEQRILADIEARLRADDPTFVENVRATPPAPSGRLSLRLAVVGTLVGFALLIVGLQAGLVWGVLGFGLMLASVYQALVIVRRAASGPPGADGSSGAGPLQRYLGAGRRRDDQER